MPARIELLDGEEIFQVMVVRDHLERVLGPLQPVSPHFQGDFHGQQLQVIVHSSAGWDQAFWIRRCWNDTFGDMVLRQHCPYPCDRGIHFKHNGIWLFEDMGGDEGSFELTESVGGFR